MARANQKLMPGHIVTAAGEGDMDTVRKVLQLYPDEVDIQHNGCTALQTAARGGYTEIIGLLASTKHSADLDFCDHEYNTPLHYAVKANKPQAVELLLKFGAKMEEPNIHQDTPPQIAFDKEYKDCLRIFMKMNKDVKLRKKKMNVEKKLPAVEEKQVADKKIRVKMCHFCNEQPVMIIFEPCGHKRSCFECSLKKVACDCGEQIKKMCFEDCPEIDDFIEVYKKNQEKVQDFEAQKLCGICADEAINCTLQCGHMFCETCVRRRENPKRNENKKQIWICYFCKKPSRFTKVFMPFNDDNDRK